MATFSLELAIIVVFACWPDDHGCLAHVRLVMGCHISLTNLIGSTVRIIASVDLGLQVRVSTYKGIMGVGYMFSPMFPSCSYSLIPRLRATFKREQLVGSKVT